MFNVMFLPQPYYNLSILVPKPFGGQCKSKLRSCVKVEVDGLCSTSLMLYSLYGLCGRKPTRVQIASAGSWAEIVTLRWHNQFWQFGGRCRKARTGFGVWIRIKIQGPNNVCPISEDIEPHVTLKILPVNRLRPGGRAVKVLSLKVFLRSFWERYWLDCDYEL